MRQFKNVASCVVAAVLLLAAVPVLAQDPIVKELTRLEDLWSAASIKKDGAAVGRLLASGFIGTGEDGKVNDKAAVIKMVAEDKETYVSAGNSGYQAKVHGNTAVIVGTWTAVVKTATGTETRRWAWTDTWMKQADGQWLCIASQSARLPK